MLITNERELVGEIVRNSIAEFGGKYLGYSNFAADGAQRGNVADFLFQLRNGTRGSIEVSDLDITRNPGRLLDELVQSRIETAVKTGA